jgi:hypothetical protein
VTSADWRDAAHNLGLAPDEADQLQQVVEAYSVGVPDFTRRLADWAGEYGHGRHLVNVLRALDGFRDAEQRHIRLPDECVEACFRLLQWGPYEKVSDAEVLHLLRDILTPGDADQVESATSYLSMLMWEGNGPDVVQGMARMSRDLHDIENKPARGHRSGQ